MSIEGAGPGPIEHILHEIRTPLSIISGNVHIVHKHWDRLDGSKREGLLRSALAHTETLNETLRSLNHVEHIRPRRGRVSASSTGEERVEVEIELDFGSEVRTGRATAPRGPAEERRAVVCATLEALEGLLPFPVAYEDASVVLVGNRRLALVSLDKGDDTLVGSAIVRTDQDDAIARATLDCLNRFLISPALS
jgi:hypothetical protein